MTPAQLETRLQAWITALAPMLKYACPICQALGIDPTWERPQLIESKAYQFIDNAVPQQALADPGKTTTLRLVCKESGMVLLLDTTAIGLRSNELNLPTMPKQVKPKLKALEQATAASHPETQLSHQDGE